MRPGYRLAEHVLESFLNACDVHVDTMPDARCCGSVREPTHGIAAYNFHLIDMEECFLEIPMIQEQFHLHCGDLVIIQSSTRHSLFKTPRARDDEPPSIGSTSILHGEFELPTGNTSSPRGLPSWLIVRSRDASKYSRQLASILLATVREKRFGQQVLVNKLASSLLALLVCEYAFQFESTHGVFAKVQDTRIARALQAVHDRLGEQWNVRTLASVAGMSRSTFALHFTAEMGVSPMQYVALWRVEQAKRLLLDSRLSVAKVAEMLGYSSEAAFRKLFKRVEGVGPGNVRAAARYSNLPAALSRNFHCGIR